VVYNITLVDHNINYYGAIKRSTVVFAALYGIYVLQEGIGARNKAIRLSMSALVLTGVFLIITTA
jgi:hypothetical protein